MKRNFIFISLPLFFIIVFSSVDAHPAIGVETTFNYTLFLHGQQRRLNITIKNGRGALVLEWESSPYQGSFCLSNKAVQYADRMYFKQPTPFTQIQTAENETLFCFISQNAYAVLKEKSHFKYNETVYREIEEVDREFLLQKNQSLPVLHVIDEIDDSEMWILDDPLFPIVCEMRHNPRGVDFKLNAITYKNSTD